ncbi:MAG: hypothetical protein P4L99_07065 [Chthoniobacter sp.]|nr:hypothetical protein [Chthoniobacter sp.]
MIGTAYADVDFTPKESFYLAESTRVPNVAFRNGSVPITYSPPGGWTLSGSGSKVTLSPPDKPQAGATMETQPVTNLPPTTEENLKVYTDLAVSRLPQEALKVTVVEAVVCPLRFDTKTMAEVTLTYVHFGQQFTTNVILLPYNKELITFQMTARTADFAPLAKAFRASLYSMQGL